MAKDNFVIIGTARSKTTLLVSYLQQHPEIFCHGELFNQRNIIHFGFPKALEDKRLSFIQDKQLRDEKPIIYIQKVYAHQRKLKGQIIGFKLLFAQQDAMIDYLLTQKRIKKIIPIRNFLFTYTSMLFAQKTDQWRRQQGGERIVEKITLPPKTFLRNYQWNFLTYVKILQQLQQTRQAYHLLFAEDFPSPTALDDLFAFLEVTVPFESLKEKLSRQNSSNIFDRLENAEEIQTLFTGTILESFLAADKVPDREFWIKKTLDQDWIDETQSGIQALLKNWDHFPA